MKVIKAIVFGVLKFVSTAAAGAIVFGWVAYIYCGWHIRNFDPNSNGFGEGFLVLFAILTGGGVGALAGLVWALWPHPDKIQFDSLPTAGVNRSAEALRQ